jgi:signal transduction histidine kinase
MILQDEMSLWTNGVGEKHNRLFEDSENSPIAFQVLDYSGRKNFGFAPAMLNQVIKEVVQTLKSAIPSNVSINFALQPALPVFTADATQLRQVVMDLVTNAYEAIKHKRGWVSIATGCSRYDRDWLKECALGAELLPGSYLYLTVTDTGCGMNSKIIKKIFDPFFSTKVGHSGLGLATVREIVHGYNGAIHVQSTLEKGTTFTILFPLVQR